ncbi:MAG: 50S ribosomal protein L21 [Candidatus Muiribacteriota bacterium]|jgi:large subunit ribosomal protein L21
MYAIVETGGKQYRVEPKTTFKVEKLEAAENEKVELSNVLLVSDGKDLKVGSPYLETAKVVCSVLSQGKGKKVNIFRYKPKKKYRKMKGHRQPFTELRVEEIKA